MTTDQPDPGQWDCDAYGPGGRDFGALCFMAGGPGERMCPSLAACLETMTAERQRVWERLQNLKQEGHPFFAGLADMFPSPDTILGGGGGR